MNEKPTWFGFSLNEKQSITIFTFALIGLIICLFVFFMSFSSILTNLYYMIEESYYDPYYGDYYIVSILFGYLPLLLFFFIILVICIYSISKCRKTAAYYRYFHQFSQTQYQIPRQTRLMKNEIKKDDSNPMFCSNCGTPRKETHHFCVNCGKELN